MKFGISILAVALLLGGCVGAYDVNKVPAAWQAAMLVHDKCDARKSAGEFKTEAAEIDCDLVGDKAFAAAVRMTPELYTTFDARMRFIASEVDAGRISQAAKKQRYDAAYKDYEDAANAIQERAAKDNAAMAAAGL